MNPKTLKVMSTLIPLFAFFGILFIGIGMYLNISQIRIQTQITHNQVKENTEQIRMTNMQLEAMKVEDLLQDRHTDTIVAEIFKTVDHNYKMMQKQLELNRNTIIENNKILKQLVNE